MLQTIFNCKNLYSVNDEVLAGCPKLGHTTQYILHSDLSLRYGLCNGLWGLGKSVLNLFWNFKSVGKKGKTDTKILPFKEQWPHPSPRTRSLLTTFLDISFRPPPKKKNYWCIFTEWVFFFKINVNMDIFLEIRKK